MIQGGKHQFWDEKWQKKMDGSHMILWTIIRGKIYMEKSKHAELDENQIHWTREFADHF